MLRDNEYIDDNAQFKEFYFKSNFKFAPGLANGDEIGEYLEEGFLEGVNVKDINATSLDLKLNDDFLKLKENQLVDLVLKEKPETVKMEKHYSGKYVITPNMFFLGSTSGIYNLPNWLSTSVYLRSSAGRIGLNHMMAGWADPGFNGANLTLEFHNVSNNTYLINADCCFIQVCFHKSYPVSAKYDYRTKGRYNGKLGTINSKGV